MDEMRRYRVMVFPTPLSRDMKSVYLKARDGREALESVLAMWRSDMEKCGDYQVLLCGPDTEYRVLCKNAPFWDRQTSAPVQSITVRLKESTTPKPKKGKHGLRHVKRQPDQVIEGTLALLSAERCITVVNPAIARDK